MAHPKPNVRRNQGRGLLLNEAINFETSVNLRVTKGSLNKYYENLD